MTKKQLDAWLKKRNARRKELEKIVSAGYRAQRLLQRLPAQCVKGESK